MFPHKLSKDTSDSAQIPISELLKPPLTQTHLYHERFLFDYLRLCKLLWRFLGQLSVRLQRLYYAGLHYCWHHAVHSTVILFIAHSEV